MSRFKGKWAVEELSPYRVITTAELSYTTKEGVTHTVGIGFKTDGASIPRILWPFIGSPFTGRYRKPALTHDELYTTQKTTRLYADQVFLEGMEDRAVSFWKRRAMYIGVRIGGWYNWNKQKKKLLGE